MKKKILAVVAALFMIAGTSFQTKGCVPVHLSCGITMEICNFSGTSTQLINAAISMNNSLCGTNIQYLEEV